MRPSRNTPRVSSKRSEIFAQAPGLEATELLLDNIPDLLFIVKDCNRAYIAANQAFIRRAGLTNREDILGRTARELFSEVLAAGYEQDDNVVFSKGVSVRDRLEMITRADGSMGWIVSQKVPVKSISGQIIALSGISRDLSIPANLGNELSALADAIDTIHKDYALPLRIEELAKKSGLSWSQFERRVHAITGLTPRQLLTKCRIEAAARALQESNDPLASIAIDCGFYDQAALSRLFSAATGLSPGQYRKVTRKTQPHSTDVLSHEIRQERSQPGS